MASGDITQMLQAHTSQGTNIWIRQTIASPYLQTESFPHDLRLAFENRKLIWTSNEETLSSISAIFSSEVDHRRIKLCLAGVFTHVAMVPSARAMFALANLLARNIVSSIREEGDPTLVVVHDGLNNDEVSREISKIAPNPRKMTRPVKSEYLSTLSRLRHVCELSNLVPTDGALADAFATVLETLATAAARTTLTPEHLKREELRIQEDKARQRQEQVQRYGVYVKTSQEAEVWRTTIRPALFGLPKEMREYTFDKLVDVMLPTELRCLLPGELARLVAVILGAMADIGNSEYMKPNHHLRQLERLALEPDTVSKVTADFGPEVERSMLRKLPIQHNAQFPTKSLRNRLPVPALLSPDNCNVIKQLHLKLTIPESSSYYPSAVFSAQDNLWKLNRWAPNLQTVHLSIIDENIPTDEPKPWIKRLPGRGFTTMQAELTHVVGSFKMLKVREKAIRYETPDTKECFSVTEDPPFDLTAMTSADIAQVLTAGMGEWLEI